MSSEQDINQVPIQDLTPEQASHIIHSHRKVRYGMSTISPPRGVTFAKLVALIGLQMIYRYRMLAMQVRGGWLSGLSFVISSVVI